MLFSLLRFEVKETFDYPISKGLYPFNHLFATSGNSGVNQCKFTCPQTRNLFRIDALHDPQILLKKDKTSYELQNLKHSEIIRSKAKHKCTYRVTRRHCQCQRGIHEISFRTGKQTSRSHHGPRLNG